VSWVLGCDWFGCVRGLVSGGGLRTVREVPESALLVVLGGLFGFLLGKTLDAAPKWVTWAVLATFVVLAIITFKPTVT